MTIATQLAIALAPWCERDRHVRALGSAKIWAWSYVGCVREIKKRENLCWRLHGRTRENMHPRKFPAIRYIPCSTIKLQRFGGFLVRISLASIAPSPAKTDEVLHFILPF